MTGREIYAQGDILIERVVSRKSKANQEIKPINVDPDGAVVLARGEVTGHRHAFYNSGVTMFRDDAIARDMNVPDMLYVGSLKIEAPSALKHEEHDTIALEPGEYIVRRQREFDAEAARIVAD